MVVVDLTEDSSLVVVPELDVVALVVELQVR